MPVFVLLAVYFLYRSRATITQIIGVITTLLGVFVVATQGTWSRLAEFDFTTGDLLMIIACILYGGYAAGLKQRPAVSTLSFLTVLAGVAFLTSLPFLVGEILTGYFLVPTRMGWILILLITLLPSFLGQIFFMRGVAIIGPDRAGVFVNLVPVFAALFAVWFLAESFYFYHGVALFLVLAGIAISERGKRPVR